MQKQIKEINLYVIYNLLRFSRIGKINSESIKCELTHTYYHLIRVIRQSKKVKLISREV